MKKITTLCATLMLTVFGWQANAQYCAAGPSSTFDTNVESVALTGDAATAINYTGCPGVSGLEDQTTTQTVSLTAGSPYTANVQFGTCGGTIMVLVKLGLTGIKTLHLSRQSLSVLGQELLLLQSQQCHLMFLH